MNKGGGFFCELVRHRNGDFAPLEENSNAGEGKCVAGRRDVTARAERYRNWEGSRM